MMKYIVVVALVCVFGSSGSGLCNSGQTPGPLGCLDLVVEIVTAPCQLLATCLGMEGPRCVYHPPCRPPRPRVPVKKEKKSAVEEYSTKVVAPTPDQPEPPSRTRQRPPAEPARPERASWPPVTREQPPQPPAAAQPPATAQPPAVSPPRPPAPPSPVPSSAPVPQPPVASSPPPVPRQQPPTESPPTGDPTTGTVQKPPAKEPPPAPPAPRQPREEPAKTIPKPGPAKEKYKAPCGPVYPVVPCIPAPCLR